MVVRDLGKVTWEELEPIVRITQNEVRNGGTEIWLLHELPISISYSITESYSDVMISKEVLKSRGISVYACRRHGDVQLHCPGQLYIRPVIRVTSSDMDGFNRRLSGLMAFTLSEFKVEPKELTPYYNLHSRRGIISWVAPHFEKGVTTFGATINVDPELSQFNLLQGCYPPPFKVSSIKAELKKGYPSMEEVKDKLRELIPEYFRQ